MIKAKEKQKVINPCAFFCLCFTLCLSPSVSLGCTSVQIKDLLPTWEVTSKSSFDARNKKNVPSNFSTMLNLKFVVYVFLLLHQKCNLFYSWSQWNESLCVGDGAGVYNTTQKRLQTSFRELNKDSKQMRRKKNTEIVGIFPSLDYL